MQGGSSILQFTITIAVSVIISTVVALTLQSVICAYLLKPDKGGRKKQFFGISISGLAKGNNALRPYDRSGARPFAPACSPAFGVVLIGIWLMNKLVPEFHAAGGSGLFHPSSSRARKGRPSNVRAR